MDELAEYYLELNVWEFNQEDMDTYHNETIGNPQHALAYHESATLFPKRGESGD